MATEINSILRKFLTAVGKNEAAAVELSKELRSWVQDNGEIVKERIENRIEDTASRMGFVKESDLEKLLDRISDLESRLPEKKTTKAKGKNAVKTSVKRPVKKISASSKVASKRSSKDGTKG